MNFKFSVVLLAGIGVLQGCGDAKSPKDNASEVQWWGFDPKPNDEQFNFNFAKYVRNSPTAAKVLNPLLVDGDPYLAVGTKKTFQLQTNLQSSALATGANAGPKGEFWIDGYVFGKRLVRNEGQGLLFDVGAHLGVNPMRARANLRFIGQDKFVGDLNSEFVKILTRDLGLEVNVYPLPLLGLGVGGNIGGEFGARLAPEYQGDNAMTVDMGPKLGLVAALDGHIKLLNFLKAQIVGKVDMMKSEISSTIGQGYYPDLGLAIDSSGLEASDMLFADGKIEIVATANANLSGILPPEVDASLWVRLFDDLGLGKYEWRHIVWDPNPATVREFPGNMQSRPRLLRKMENADECQAMVVGYEARVETIIAGIDTKIAELTKAYEKDKRTTQLLQINHAKAAKENYGDLIKKVKDLCE